MSAAANEAAESSHAYAVYEAKGEFKKHVFKLHKLGDDELELRVTHSGICHSDIHTIDGDWGNKFDIPIVPGHEIVGQITKLGPNVAKLRPDFKIGTRVGVGPQALACQSCTQCKVDRQQYCTGTRAMTYGEQLPDGYTTRGGYASFHRVDCRFAVLVPEKLDPANAAPLLCAGITVYAPLKKLNVGPGMKVAIIGIGGLGHCAVQFANALGADVTAISRSAAKEDDAKKLGAHHFLLSTDQDAVKAAAGTFDVILNTVSANIDFNAMLGLVAPQGTFATVGAPPDPMSIQTFAVIFRGITIMGSLIGSPAQMEEMLKLCAEKDIVCQTEVLPFDKVNEGIQKVRDNNVRFRVVMEMPADATYAE